MGRRTGPKPSFNADDVVDAAFAGGLHVMTLAGVARSLGVAPQTLYRVYPSRDAVVVACLERAAATLSAPDPALPWSDQLRDWAESAWRVCEEFPGLDVTIHSFPYPHIAVLPVIAALRGGLADAGFPGDADLAIDMVGDIAVLAHMGVTTRASAAPWRRRAAARRVEEATGSLDAGFNMNAGWPLLRAKAAAKQWMERKVEVVIAGFAAGPLPHDNNPAPRNAQGAFLAE